MRTLPAEVDVVVIGAGVSGASIGYQLARQSDRRVAVVDARPPVGGISGRTFGQIRQHYSNELMVRMALRGFHCIRNWATEVGYGDPGYIRLGYMLIVTENQIDGLRRNVELGRRLGVDTSFVGPDEIAAVEPLVNAERLAGGAYEPDGGYIDVTKMVLSWLGAATAAGAEVLAPLAVEEILVSDGAVAGVATARGVIAAPVVVVATGAWARDLLNPLGVHVPIERRRLDLAMLEQEPGARALHTFITDGNSNLVIRPDMGRRVLAVAYPPEMPEVDDPLADAGPVDHEDHCGAHPPGRGRAPTGHGHRQDGVHDQRGLRHHPGLSPDPGLGQRDRRRDRPVPGRRILRSRAQAVALGRRDHRVSCPRHRTDWQRSSAGHAATPT